MAYSNSLKDNIFLVGILLTVTNSLFHKNVHLFQFSPRKADFSPKEVIYVIYPKDQCLAFRESLC